MVSTAATVEDIDRPGPLPTGGVNRSPDAGNVRLPDDHQREVINPRRLAMSVRYGVPRSEV